MSTELDVRRATESYLRVSIPQKTWEYLRRKHYVAETIRGRLAIEDLAEEARMLLGLSADATNDELSRLRGFVDPELGRLSPGRIEVVSTLLASTARRDDAVKRFRQEVLKGNVIRTGEVGRWIKDLAKREGKSTRFAKVPLPASSSHPNNSKSRTSSRVVINSKAITETFTEELSYIVPNSEYVEHIPITAAGVLHRLHRLSTHLARQFVWQQAQATTFVLTDQIPLIRTISVQTTTRFDFSALSRITIVVDPTVPPSEVTEAFRRARAEILPARPRAISEKHLSLVLFCDRCPDDQKWMDRMCGWNSEHPEWTYTEVKNFIRDANQGLRRLLGRGHRFLSAKEARK